MWLFQPADIADIADISLLVPEFDHEGPIHDDSRFRQTDIADIKNSLQRTRSLVPYLLEL